MLAALPSSAKLLQAFANKTQQRQRSTRVACRADASSAATQIDRRSALAAFAAAVLAAQAPLACLAEDFERYYGTASPPTSYGGYGGNAQEDAKYTFEYPVGWKTAQPNKVEKGTQGIDVRVFNPSNKKQQITVITFGRAGEDNKSFRLTDIETTFTGFAVADYDMQDALSNATDKVTNEREVGGQRYYDYAIDSPDVQYLSTITVYNGKVYALFVKSPTRSFAANAEALRHVVQSFATVPQAA